MNTSVDQILQYLAQAGLVSLSQLIILLGPILVLGFITYFVTKAVRSQSAVLFSWKLWVYGTFLGTIVHELGHAIFAILFGHKIVAIQLFAPDPNTGTLGYVSHSYNKNNVYQSIGNFFIGIGPIILGPLVIYLAALYLVGADVFAPLQSLQVSGSASTSLGSLGGMLSQALIVSVSVLQATFAPEHFSTWQFFLFLYIAISVGAHIQLSPPDIQGAFTGLVVFVLAVVLFNLATLWAGNFVDVSIQAASHISSFFYAVMLFTISLNLAVLVVFTFLAILRRIFGR